ncbi:hypothetical protein [Chondromyces apiculatus]|uniref:Uncharacterized protein n=1 Tax=Chondromyces apiculatus DSM 436 TaxID=1192034 RepID=A0A017TJ01_9BACT|nr:hypothetical protein [Chondromyces apiculatus]EYF08566.1 Hypothetical protein CAP_4096 [Chondromyces apiculatus DSM 436]
MQTHAANVGPGITEVEVAQGPEMRRAERAGSAGSAGSAVPRRGGWLGALGLSGWVALGGIALGGLSLGAIGCGPPPARAPNAVRLLDERRAIEVIRRAMTQEGTQPAPAREVKLLSTGAMVQVDVGVQGHDYGVVYVTQEDADKLGVAIPPANRQEEKLRLVRAGEDGETRLVLLYQTNYRYDDLVGEEHEQTTITAERQLTRDVQDFVTHARTRKFR